MTLVKKYLLDPNKIPQDTDILKIPEWQTLLESSYSEITGSDATSTQTWAAALIDTIIPGKKIEIVHIGNQERITGILPYFREQSKINFLGARKIKAITEAHAGRSNFITLSNASILSHEIIEALHTRISDWDLFQYTTVSNSVTHKTIYERMKCKKLLARCTISSSSPYIKLSKDWINTFNSLPKKLRWSIRKSEKELCRLGTLTYREFSASEEIDELFSNIYNIERESWKEHAKSSITTQDRQRKFYEALAKYTARDRILSAHVLLLDNKPLAYILGILSGDGSFLDLKESFVDSYSKYSPSHVLKSFAIANLIKQCVRIYDFMGDCEPYKMRWTDKVYERHTIIIYNKTVRGRLAYFKSLLTRGHKSVPAPSKLNLAPQETD